MSKNIRFVYYAEKKGEDAPPFNDGRICAVADGLGGSGKCVHTVDGATALAELKKCAFSDFDFSITEVGKLFDDTCAAIACGNEHTSAAWAARIVLARAVYALKFGAFSGGEYRDEKSRAKLARFIRSGLDCAAKHFGFSVSDEDSEALLPTTFAAVIAEDNGGTASIDVLWAGDSRCYVLTSANGLQRLTIDDEDDLGAIDNLFYAFNDEVELNYRHYEIKKPCAVLALSDGNFDPFYQGENIVLECTFLSAIERHDGIDGVADTLKSTYALIDHDDSTCAFAALGFDDLADMRERFAARFGYISAAESAITVYGDDLRLVSSDPDGSFAKSAVKRETLQKFDTALTYLLTLYFDGKKDIALTYDVRSIISLAVHAVGKPAPDGIKREFDRLFDEMGADPDIVADYLRNDLPELAETLKDIRIDKYKLKELRAVLESLLSAEKERHALVSYAVDKNKQLDAEFYDDVRSAPTAGVVRTANYAAAWRAVLLQLRGQEIDVDTSLLNDGKFVKRLADYEATMQNAKERIKSVLYVELPGDADVAEFARGQIAEIEKELPHLNKTLAEQVISFRAEMTAAVEKEPKTVSNIFDREAYMAFDKYFAVSTAAMPTLRMMIADNRENVAAAVAKGLVEDGSQKSVLDTLYSPKLLMNIRRRYYVLTNKRARATVEKLHRAMQKAELLSLALLQK